jgi:hypothetical protein
VNDAHAREAEEERTAHLLLDVDQLLERLLSRDLADPVACGDLLVHGLADRRHDAIRLIGCVGAGVGVGASVDNMITSPQQQ